MEDYITIDEFKRIRLKTAKVMEAEKIPGSARLLKLKIKVGDEERTLVAGIGHQYTPEEVVGLTLIIVANLKPRVIRGIESQGMMLAVVDEGNIIPLTTLKPAKDGLNVE